MSDTESREQHSRHSTPPAEPHARRPPARPEREQVDPGVSSRLADLQRCIDMMHKTNAELETRVVDLECSVSRIGSAFGQMAGLHSFVTGGVSRGRGVGYAERGSGGQRDFYNRQDPPRGEHAPPSFGNGGPFNGRGRGGRK